MLPNLIRNVILDILFDILAYAQGILRKKSILLDSLIALYNFIPCWIAIAIKLFLLDSLIASFVKQFKVKPWKH